LLIFRIVIEFYNVRMFVATTEYESIGSAESNMLKKIQGVRGPGGHVDEDYLRQMQLENRVALGYPPPLELA
jgi:hypothetical protein